MLLTNSALFPELVGTGWKPTSSDNASLAQCHEILNTLYINDMDRLTLRIHNLNLEQGKKYLD